MRIGGVLTQAIHYFSIPTMNEKFLYGVEYREIEQWVIHAILSKVLYREFLQPLFVTKFLPKGLVDEFFGPGA